MVPDCPEGNRGNSSRNASISDEVKETPISTLTILVNKVEGGGVYQMQDEWQVNHHADHHHLGEDGFFCNPVGMGIRVTFINYREGQGRSRVQEKII